ncbi:MAG: nucleotide exchange factor GrpE [Lachnospiraceae bacterium]|jgi:Molecular chaperone GrpE (heat shock protein)
MKERKRVVVEEKELDEEIKKEVDSEEGDSEEEILEESNPESTEPEVEASEEDTTSEADTTKKKSFFGREKKEKPNKLQEKVDELEDRVKRQMAEFENFRKRSEKEKSAMFETGAKSVVEKILPVVDNFERGLAGLSEEERKQPFAEGMNMVYKQLITELEKLEVKPIEAVGCEFNPGLHNAVMQVESEEYESGIIAQELQRGYTYRDSVVRHSMVAVVQ